MSGAEDLDAAVRNRREGVGALLAGLVRCASVGPGPGLEGAFALVQEYLADVNVDLRIDRPAPQLPVLFATLGPELRGPHVVLNGHLDVVPAGDPDWMHPPFSGQLIDGRVHGRGSADMKAGVSACAAAFAALADAPGTISGPVSLLLTPDEEVASVEGLLPWLQQQDGKVADWGICAEPTGLQPRLGNRGLVWAEVEFQGQTAHAGIPDQGINPLPAVAALIQSVGQTRFAAFEDPLVHPATLTATTVTAGDVINCIAPGAVVGLDRRLVPGEHAADAIDQIEQLARDACIASPGVTCLVKVGRSMPPCYLAPSTALAQAALRAARQVHPRLTFGYDDAGSDASHLAAHGVPTVVWGPGEPEQAHVSNESVSLTEVEQAVGAYATAIATIV